MSLLQLVYVSSATRPFSPEELAELLRLARPRNRELGVTGMLLYHDGNFVQVLEGEPESVEALFQRIEHDPRHHGILSLLRRSIAAREFGEWQMGFLDLGELSPEELEGYTDFLRVEPSEPERGVRARKLLLSFRRNLR